jgi:hypothetical protein
MTRMAPWRRAGCGFGLDGTECEIDLNAEHAQALRSTRARYTGAPPAGDRSKAPGPGASAGSHPEMKERPIPVPSTGTWRNRLSRISTRLPNRARLVVLPLRH